jgi:hypothetical protein
LEGAAQKLTLMDTIVVYSASQSNRLNYVLDWLLKERLQLDHRIISDEREATQGLCLSYGKALPGAISIPDAGLLWQTGHAKLPVNTGKWNELPALFALNGSCTLPFDMLSAIFFLLSRYEEYYPFRPDKHERYPATESILYKQSLLLRPIVDEWVSALRGLLVAAGVEVPRPEFHFQPTYDIDMAYSHLHKGTRRIVGAYIRALLKGDVKQISERTQVLKNKQKDPYDSFRWLRQLHKEYDQKPVYFILSALKTTAFDKNIHPQHPAMMRVIRNIAKEGQVGMHPSYYSDEDGRTEREKQMLEQVSSRSISISRQHYIRLKMPATYRMLLNNGIREDHSMGYGAHLGFRAGTGSSFIWYDLEREQATTLRIHPFCFMDTTAHYEQQMTAAQAFEQLDKMCAALERTGSTLITIFHNFSLGTGNEWRGWRQAYEHFMMEKATKQKEALGV